MAPNINGKRTFDTIDLTGDDDAASSSQSRRAPPTDGISQSQRDTWLEHADEGDADDIVISSQDGDGSAMQTYQLYGERVEARIVEKFRQ